MYSLPLNILHSKYMRSIGNLKYNTILKSVAKFKNEHFINLQGYNHLTSIEKVKRCSILNILVIILF